MANDVIAINYSQADAEIKRIEEGISNLHTNFGLINKATNDIVNNAWKGKDAEAYKNSIDSFTEVLKKQTEGLTTLVNILKRQIDEDIAHEAEQAKNIQNK